MGDADPKIGTVVGDRFRLEERLAAGGMGVVYRGVTVDDGQPVAVKFLHEAFAGLRDLVKRFDREVSAMRRLSHPNLVSILDSGVQNGVPWLVMDFHAGRPLADILERGALKPDRAVRIAIDVLAGVQHAHRNGVLHRDLKPDNIMLVDEDGKERIKILDFGLAKMASDEGATQLTNTGFALGTPGYMSPEQAKGVATDERTDLYAIGVVLYHMVTGRKPFVADSPMAVVRMHMDDLPLPPRRAAPDSGISAELEAVILRVLEKDPGRRYANAAAFANALAATPEGGGLGSPRVSGPLKRRLAQLALVLLCVAGAAVGWSRLQSRHRQRVEREIDGAVNAAKGAAHAAKGAANAAKGALKSLGDATRELTAAERNRTAPSATEKPPLPTVAPTADDDERDDDDTGALAVPEDTPGRRLEGASGTGDKARAEPAAKRPLRIDEAQRLLQAGKIDEAIQTLYVVRRQAPKSVAVALLLGHAYFAKLWRADGLREYDTALQLRPSLRNDKQLVRNVVSALDSSSSRLARALIRGRIHGAAVPELRRAARASRSPKMQQRANRLAQELVRRPKRR